MGLEAKNVTFYYRGRIKGAERQRENDALPSAGGI